MTRTQYFMILWLFSSVMVVLGSIVAHLTELDEIASSLFVWVPIAAASILFYGFVLACGMDFAQKIGIRFLLLEKNVDWSNDLFKPAIGMGVMYAGAALLVNIFIPLNVCNVNDLYVDLYVLVHQHVGMQAFFYIALTVFLGVINYNISLLLFWFSGAVLLMKKFLSITCGTACGQLSAIIPGVITFAVLFPLIKLVWSFGIPGVLYDASTVDALFYAGMTALLGILFWKKGFETAVLCNIVIAAILCLIAPAIIFAMVG